jgi:hypothetical protein
MSMKKFWTVMAFGRGYNANAENRGVSLPAGLGQFNSKEAAVEELKRRVAADKNQTYDYYVLEAVTAAKVPVPEVDVVDLK